MADKFILFAGAVIAAIIGAWAVLRARRPRKAKVELVDAASHEGPRVELLDITVSEERSWPWPESPIADVKVRNRGGESAVLKRLVVDVLAAGRVDVVDALSPRAMLGGPALLSKSATYEVTLPAAETAAGKQVSINISHVIAQGEADRFQVQLRHERSSAPRKAFMVNDGGSSVYLLRLTILYNASDQRASFRPVAVVCPANILYVPSVMGMRETAHRFRTEVYKLRREIDQEMATRGLVPPNWIASPPRRREDLPPRLTAIDVEIHGQNWSRVNGHFWNPERTIQGYLEAAESVCRQIIDVVPPDLPDGLEHVVPHARETLEQLPAIREEFCELWQG